ncbi:hypothetical protein STEG23_011278 [Scotinomys teguina]
MLFVLFWVSGLSSLWVLVLQAVPGVGFLFCHEPQAGPVIGGLLPQFLHPLYPSTSYKENKFDIYILRLFPLKVLGKTSIVTNTEKYRSHPLSKKHLPTRVLQKTATNQNRAIVAHPQLTHLQHTYNTTPTTQHLQHNTYNTTPTTQTPTTQHLQHNTYNTTQHLQHNTYNTTQHLQHNTYNTNTYNTTPTTQHLQHNTYTTPTTQHNTYNTTPTTQTPTTQHLQHNTYNTTQHLQHNTYNTTPTPQHLHHNTYNTTPTPAPQGPQYGGKSLKARAKDMFAVRFHILENRRAAIPSVLKSHQHGCLNKTWKRTIPMNILTGKGDYFMGPQP